MMLYFEGTTLHNETSEQILHQVMQSKKKQSKLKPEAKTFDHQRNVR